MKSIIWSTEKSILLKSSWGICFEDVVFYIENEEELFLKTIIPSRKATQKYHGEKNWI
jgi:hypothetical protein